MKCNQLGRIEKTSFWNLSIMVLQLVKFLTLNFRRVYSNNLTKGSYGWICQWITINWDFSFALDTSVFGLKTPQSLRDYYCKLGQLVRCFLKGILLWIINPWAPQGRKSGRSELKNESLGIRCGSTGLKFVQPCYNVLHSLAVSGGQAMEWQVLHGERSAWPKMYARRIYGHFVRPGPPDVGGGIPLFYLAPKSVMASSSVLVLPLNGSNEECVR